MFKIELKYSSWFPSYIHGTSCIWGLTLVHLDPPPWVCSICFQELNSLQLRPLPWIKPCVCPGPTAFPAASLIYRTSWTPLGLTGVRCSLHPDSTVSVLSHDFENSLTNFVVPRSFLSHKEVHFLYFLGRVCQDAARSSGRGWISSSVLLLCPFIFLCLHPKAGAWLCSHVLELRKGSFWTHVTFSQPGRPYWTVEKAQAVWDQLEAEQGWRELSQYSLSIDLLLPLGLPGHTACIQSHEALLTDPTNIPGNDNCDVNEECPPQA